MDEHDPADARELVLAALSSAERTLIRAQRLMNGALGYNDKALNPVELVLQELDLVIDMVRDNHG